MSKMSTEQRVYLGVKADYDRSVVRANEITEQACAAMERMSDAEQDEAWAKLDEAIAATGHYEILKALRVAEDNLLTWAREYVESGKARKLTSRERAMLKTLFDALKSNITIKDKVLSLCVRLAA